MSVKDAIGLDPTRCVVGDPSQSGEWSAEDRAFITTQRQIYPELSTWGDAAIGFAWGAFSEDIHLVSWAHWITDRDPAFLAYLYVKQARPAFDFGRCGGWDQDLHEIAAMRPWQRPGQLLPAWCGN